MTVLSKYKSHASCREGHALRFKAFRIPKMKAKKHPVPSCRLFLSDHQILETLTASWGDAQAAAVLTPMWHLRAMDLAVSPNGWNSEEEDQLERHSKKWPSLGIDTYPRGRFVGLRDQRVCDVYVYADDCVSSCHAVRFAFIR